MIVFMKKQKKSPSKKKVVKKSLKKCKFEICNKVKNRLFKCWKKIVLVVGLIGLLFYFKGMFVVALVNNRPIFRYSYIKELETQGGQQVLDTLMTKTMILQEAKKQGVKVSQEEMEAEVLKIEEIAQQQGMELDELLKLQNVKRSNLMKQIELQKMIEKLAGEGVEVSDEEADVYLEENSDFLPEDSSPEELMEIAKEQLKQQQLNQKIQEIVFRLKDEAKVVSWL